VLSQRQSEWISVQLLNRQAQLFGPIICISLVGIVILSPRHLVVLVEILIPGTTLDDGRSAIASVCGGTLSLGGIPADVHATTWRRVSLIAAVGGTQKDGLLGVLVSSLERVNARSRHVVDPRLKVRLVSGRGVLVSWRGNKLLGGAKLETVHAGRGLRADRGALGLYIHLALALTGEHAALPLCATPLQRTLSLRAQELIGLFGAVLGDGETLRSTTHEVLGGTRPARKRGEAVRTNVVGHHAELLLIATVGRHVSRHAQTRTDEPTLGGRQIVHATGDILTVIQIVDGLAKRELHIGCRVLKGRHDLLLGVDDTTLWVIGVVSSRE